MTIGLLRQEDLQTGSERARQGRYRPRVTLRRKLPIVAATLAVALASGAAIAAGWTKHDVSNQYGQATTSTNAPSASAAGLSGFKLDFKNGDHKIRSIAVTRDTSSVTTTLADGNGDDPYTIWAQYTAVPMTTADGSAECREMCQIKIDRPPSAGAHLVIRGFWFQRNGSDANLRRITVDPDPSHGVIDVQFVDNGFSNYRARVQYGYVDASRVKGTHRSAGDRVRQETSLMLTREPGQPLLQGFDVRFRNTDHYLRTFGIEPTSSQWRVTFNDKNTDDDYQVSVDYLILK